MNRAENLAVAAVIARWADIIERDRHEPDKVLCHVASLRRVALDYRLDAEGIVPAVARKEQPDA